MAFIDHFNRADSVGLGASWGTVSGNISSDVVSNQAKNTGASFAGNYVLNVTYGVPCYVEERLITVSGSFTNYLDLVSSGVGGTHGYGYSLGIQDPNSTSHSLYKITNGSATFLGGFTQTVVTGDIVRLALDANNVVVYWNGSVVLTVADTTYRSTSMATRFAQDVGNIIDDFYFDGVSPPLSNNFDGGTNGVAIDTSNSGGASGNTFDQAPGSLNQIFSNEHPHSGTLGAKIVDQTGGTIFVGWTGLGSITTDVYARAYLYLTAYPTGNHLYFFGFRTASDTFTGGVRITTSAGGNVVTAVDSTVTGFANGSVLPNLNALFRLEARLNVGTSTIEWRLFNSADSTTITDSALGTGTLGANVDKVYFGENISNPTTPFSVWFDDVAFSTTGWIGPTQVHYIPPITYPVAPRRW